MSRGRVLLTGATGFIGSHIADALLAADYEVIALRRIGSDAWRLEAAETQLIWVNTDEPDWHAQLLSYKIDTLVHAAWLGVRANQRDDWPSQLSNLDFVLQLLDVLAQGPLRQVVALGSQAEYGIFEGRANEDHALQPATAYGAVKLATMQVVRTFCETRGFAWYWLRIFAVFGPREDAHWFVSHIVTSLLANVKPLEMTLGEQQYDYSYVRDLAQAVSRVISYQAAPSGIYNLAANSSISLRSLVALAQELTASPTQVHFGAVPYRAGQVMCMEGNSDRFESVFGPISVTPLRVAMAETIAYWQDRKNQSNAN